MFLPFYHRLRQSGVPVSLREYLAFLEGMARGLATYNPDGFYVLARTAMVKDERHLDRFDRAFAASFNGLAALTPAQVLDAIDLPKDWLENAAAPHLTPDEIAAIQALGGLDALMQALRDRLAEQTGRHAGGSKWIGTGGTSPFGAHGHNPEGVRIGQDAGRTGQAVKIWDRREFRALDDRADLGSRNMKLALRRLRRWARDGAAQELDLDGTIRATAEQGWLDVQTRPERRNAVKVLLFLDIGGSMDAHVRVVEDLFAAARSEFRSLSAFYFHNCLYEGLWRDTARSWDAQLPTWDILRSHGADHKAIFVGDATMSPYEITHPGGAVEHWNAEPGALWLERACAQWPAHLWINPVPEAAWDHTHSTRMIRQIFGGRMVPMTPDGIARGIRDLSR